eukprot:5208903-Alexandrium_andersonii.AAC.1
MAAVAAARLRPQAEHGCQHLLACPPAGARGGPARAVGAKPWLRRQALCRLCRHQHPRACGA